MFDGLCRYVHKGGFALFYFFYLLHTSIRRQKNSKVNNEGANIIWHKACLSQF